VDGLEHKDERLHAVEGPDWRDKLARLRDELSDDEGDRENAADRGGEEGR
jgi:hypothetical protein